MGLIYRPANYNYSVHGIGNVKFPVGYDTTYTFDFPRSFFPPLWSSVNLTIIISTSFAGSTGSNICVSHVHNGSGLYYTGTNKAGLTVDSRWKKYVNGTYNITISKFPIWFFACPFLCFGGFGNYHGVINSCKIEFRNALNQDDTRVLIWDNNLPVPNTGTLDEFINSDGSGSDVAEDFYDPTGNSTPSSPTALHRIDHYVTVKNIEDPKLDISMVINKVIWDIKSQTLYYINRNGVVNKLGPKEAPKF